MFIVADLVSLIIMICKYAIVYYVSFYILASYINECFNLMIF